MDALNLMDVRVQKSVDLGHKQKAVVRLNVFNALNINAVTGLTMQSGPAFLTATEIIPPRIYELSVA